MEEDSFRFGMPISHAFSITAINAHSTLTYDIQIICTDTDSLCDWINKMKEPMNFNLFKKAF